MGEGKKGKKYDPAFDKRTNLRNHYRYCKNAAADVYSYYADARMSSGTKRTALPPVGAAAPAGKRQNTGALPTTVHLVPAPQSTAVAAAAAAGSGGGGGSGAAGGATMVHMGVRDGEGAGGGAGAGKVDPGAAQPAAGGGGASVPVPASEPSPQWKAVSTVKVKFVEGESRIPAVNWGALEFKTGEVAALTFKKLVTAAAAEYAVEFTGVPTSQCRVYVVTAAAGVTGPTPGEAAATVELGEGQLWQLVDVTPANGIVWLYMTLPRAAANGAHAAGLAAAAPAPISALPASGGAGGFVPPSGTCAVP